MPTSVPSIRSMSPAGIATSPPRCVCNDGADTGRRFLVCNTCESVKWVDGEWEGRAKDGIQDLAMKNKKLERTIKEIEVEKSETATRSENDDKVAQRATVFKGYDAWIW